MCWLAVELDIGIGWSLYAFLNAIHVTGSSLVGKQWLYVVGEFMATCLGGLHRRYSKHAGVKISGLAGLTAGQVMAVVKHMIALADPRVGAIPHPEKL